MVLGQRDRPPDAERRYRNPVSRGVATTVADPSVIRGKDGWWYEYATAEPHRVEQGDPVTHLLPILRSRDLIRWEPAGDVFTEATRPSWHPANGGLWAPDIRYLDGRYVLYYSAAPPPGGPDSVANVGVATAPTPRGPWTDSGAPVVPPGACDTLVAIDPAQFTAADGVRYLVWGSFRHLCVAALDPSATRITGAVTEVYTGPGEGGYVVRHEGLYYLFVSESSCCLGPLSGYQVRVGRAQDPRGPYLDRDGTALTEPRTKGELVLTTNGNRWTGPGHSAVATDSAGQDWLVYHANDRTAAPLSDAGAQPRRELLIDRLDWVDGWPVVRAGQGPSDASTPAPRTAFAVGESFSTGAEPGPGWRREGAGQEGWRLVRDPDAGGVLRQDSPVAPAYLVTEDEAPADVRVEGDLRVTVDPAAGGGVGLVLDYASEEDHVAAWLDPRARELVTDVVRDGRPLGQQRTALPAGTRLGTWHNLAVERRGTQLTAELTSARLDDPIAAQRRELPEPGGADSVGVVSLGAGAEADNLGATPLAAPAPASVVVPTPGATTAEGDEFELDGDPAARAGSPWSWTAGPRGTVAGGALRWAAADPAAQPGPPTSLLLRNAPPGDYVLEAQLTYAPTQPGHHAGLVVAGRDEAELRLGSSMTGGGANHDGPMLQTEWVTAGRHPTGVSFVGPPAPTLQLRLHHRYDERAGEHEFRAASSPDGRRWTYGGVWTLPGRQRLRIGLTASAAGPAAAFDHLRVLRP